MRQASNDHLNTLLDYLQRSRGFDFRGYKRASLSRRIDKRMDLVRAQDYEAYLDYLEVHPEEFSQLFNTILINVTAFFRDPQSWQYLASDVLPGVLSAKETNTPIRVWSAGCASGEEAYTIAILLAEALGAEAFRQRVKIYATDADEEALAQARQASYSEKDIEAIPPELREKYFELNGEHYIFRSELRRAIIFGRHDLIGDAPISRLDLIVCRNTLMYFNAETQMRILARLHFALDDNGVLFLGRAEMLLTHANLFSPLELKYRLFKKVRQTNNLRERLFLLTQTGHHDVNNQVGRQIRLRELAFETSPTARLVVDATGNLAMVNTEARRCFGIDIKDIGRPFQDLELSYRPVELRSMVQEVSAQLRTLRRTNIERMLPDSTTQHLDVEVSPLLDNGNGVVGVSVTFFDITKAHQLETDLQRAKQDVETAYEELQSTNEELETTNEELQSTVEELETTNEELQSSNEEMETMNEELQSTNEELQTLNDELRTRTDELGKSNGFLNSIVASVVSGVIVIDEQLRVLIWNPAAEDQWGLRTAEVKGQGLLNLDIGLPVQTLRGPIRDVLTGTVNRQSLTVTAINRRGKTAHCHIVCTPLLNSTQAIHGVVLLIEESSRAEKFAATHNPTMAMVPKEGK